MRKTPAGFSLACSTSRRPAELVSPGWFGFKSYIRSPGTARVTSSAGISRAQKSFALGVGAQPEETLAECQHQRYGTRDQDQLVLDGDRPLGPYPFGSNHSDPHDEYPWWNLRGQVLATDALVSRRKEGSSVVAAITRTASWAGRTTPGSEPARELSLFVSK
jgi:hypothetical protein